MRVLLKALWARWKLIAQKIADFQARAMLSAFYFAVLGPFALGLKICSDPLRLHRAAAESWLPRPQTPGDAVTLARRQF